jgi:hypothetical protein
LATSKSVAELGNEFYWSAKPQEQIWVLPLGNIYPEAKLCQGGNSIPKGPYKDNFRGLDWHFAVLYSSPFNNDLSISSISNPDYCSRWYSKIQNMPIFPYELMPYGKKLTRVSKSTGQEIAADMVDQASLRF